MRTNIVIDDDLLEGAMRATGAKTKREAVELGLASLIRLKAQEDILRISRLFGATIKNAFLARRG